MPLWHGNASTKAQIVIILKLPRLCAHICGKCGQALAGVSRLELQQQRHLTPSEQSWQTELCALACVFACSRVALRQAALLFPCSNLRMEKYCRVLRPNYIYIYHCVQNIATMRLKTKNYNSISILNKASQNTEIINLLTTVVHNRSIKKRNFLVNSIQ